MRNYLKDYLELKRVLMRKVIIQKIEIQKGGGKMKKYKVKIIRENVDAKERNM